MSLFIFFITLVILRIVICKLLGVRFTSPSRRTSRRRRHTYWQDESHHSPSHFGRAGHENFSGINPATGLPMIGGTGGVDAAGNPYGTDLHH